MTNLQNPLASLNESSSLDYIVGKESLTESIYSYSVHLMAHIQVTVPYLGLLALIYIVYEYFVYRLYLHPANRLPGPSTDLLFPFLGNIRELASGDWGTALCEWRDKYGPLFRAFVHGNAPYVVVGDHGLMKYILSKEQSKFSKPPEIKDFLSTFTGKNGILVIDGNEHKITRKRLHHALGPKVIERAIPAITQSTQQLIRMWSTQCSSPKEIIISDAMMSLTMEVIGLTAFGQTFNCVADPENHILSQAYLDSASGDSPLVSLLLVCCPWVMRLPLPRMAQWRYNIKTAIQEVDKVITSSQQDPNLHQRDDILANLIRLKDTDDKGLTLDELRDDCLIILGAGHETTSTCLSWTLYELARNQDVQDKLRQEIHNAFPDQSSECEHPSYDKTIQLPYLDNVFKESLRYNAPLPISVKVSHEDFVWKDQVFPKGTRFAISSQLQHSDKSVWGEDCDKFLPSRWDCAPANTISSYDYLPFYQGPRNCLGSRYATIVVKTILILLIRNFKFTLKPGFKPQKKFIIALKPSPNMTLMVEKINP